MGLILAETVISNNKFESWILITPNIPKQLSSIGSMLASVTDTCPTLYQHWSDIFAWADSVSLGEGHIGGRGAASKYRQKGGTFGKTGILASATGAGREGGVMAHRPAALETHPSHVTMTTTPTGLIIPRYNTRNTIPRKYLPPKYFLKYDAEWIY